MSKNHTSGDRADRFFHDCIRWDATLDDIAQLGTRLPDDREVLRALALRCRSESRKALHIGHHIEGRRLGILADQFDKLAAASDT
jgi:hypothetical protein